MAATVLLVAMLPRLRLFASYAQFHGDFGTEPLTGSPVGYALLWMTAVVAGAVAWTIHVLRRLASRTATNHELTSAAAWRHTVPSCRLPKPISKPSPRLSSTTRAKPARKSRKPRRQSGWELTVRVRLGEPELVQEAGHRSVALRVMRGGRVALTSTSDLSPTGLARAVSDAMELVELSEADPFAGPAPAELLCSPPHPGARSVRPRTWRAWTPIAPSSIAKRGERAALGFDPRITLSEGASFSRVTGHGALVLSSGFVGLTQGSYASLVVTPVAVDVGDKRRRGHYWTARRHLAELESAEDVGAEAARRTLRQLGPRKVPTCEAPVVFSPEAARAILGTFAGCIVGGSVWRKSTYLQDREEHEGRKRPRHGRGRPIASARSRLPCLRRGGPPLATQRRRRRRAC